MDSISRAREITKCDRDIHWDFWILATFCSARAGGWPENWRVTQNGKSIPSSSTFTTATGTVGHVRRGLVAAWHEAVG